MVVRVAEVRLRALGHARALGVRGATSVLAREPATRERPERLVSELVLVADREDGLRVGTIEERERVLHPLVASEPFELRDLDRFSELLGREVRGADGADLSRPHELVERGERLLVRCVGVELVREVEGNSLDPETLQARVELAVDT